jgi:hypothetical protein
MSATARNAIIGVVATVVGGLLLAYFTGILTDATKKAKPRVTSFNVYDFVVGKEPYASISVENEGNKTAEYCIVYFRPGTVSTQFQQPVEERSNQFALAKDQAVTLTLATRLPLTSGTALSWLNATAWITCGAEQSPLAFAHVLVRST